MAEISEIVALMDKAACVLAAKGAGSLADKLQVAATLLSNCETQANAVVVALQNDIDAYVKAEIRQCELDAIAAWNRRAPSNDARDAAPDVVELSDVDVAAWVERNGLDGVLSKTDARAAFDDARTAHLIDHAGKGGMRDGCRYKNSSYPNLRPLPLSMRRA